MARSGFSRPYVVAKTAQTLDGKVATRNGHSKWITSSHTRDYARRRRDRFRAIVVGANTVVKDNPRLEGVRNKKLLKVVVDSTLRLSPRAQVFRVPERCWLATTRQAKRAKIDQFLKMGVQVILCPARAGRVSLPYLFDRLYQAGMERVLIEGGPTLIGKALREQLVDHLHIYIAPKIMGDPTALDSIVGLTAFRVDRLCQLKNVTIKRMKSDILVEADVYRNC